MGTEEYQVCDKCHKEKSIDEFDILKYNGKQYHIHTCKKCRYEIRKAKKNALVIKRNAGGQEMGRKPKQIPGRRLAEKPH